MQDLQLCTKKKIQTIEKNQDLSKSLNFDPLKVQEVKTLS